MFVIKIVAVPVERADGIRKGGSCKAKVVKIRDKISQCLCVVPIKISLV